MTQRAIFDTLEQARDEAWQAALHYERVHNVQPWPEQRGVANGLDAARRALLGDYWRPPCR